MHIPSTSKLYLHPACYYEMRAVIPLKETMKFKQSSWKKNSTLKVKHLKRVMNTYTLVSCWPELLDSLFLSLDYSRILRNRDCMSKTPKFSKTTVWNIQNLTFNLFLRESHFYIEYVIQKFLFDEILWLPWTIQTRSVSDHCF